jgi:hypothetical protein
VGEGEGREDLGKTVVLLESFDFEPFQEQPPVSVRLFAKLSWNIS